MFDLTEVVDIISGNVDPLGIDPHILGNTKCSDFGIDNDTVQAASTPIPEVNENSPDSPTLPDYEMEIEKASYKSNGPKISGTLPDLSVSHVNNLVIIPTNTNSSDGNGFSSVNVNESPIHAEMTDISDNNISNNVASNVSAVVPSPGNQNIFTGDFSCKGNIPVEYVDNLEDLSVFSDLNDANEVCNEALSLLNDVNDILNISFTSSFPKAPHKDILNCANDDASDNSGQDKIDFAINADEAEEKNDDPDYDPASDVESCDENKLPKYQNCS